MEPVRVIETYFGIVDPGIVLIMTNGVT